MICVNTSLLQCHTASVQITKLLHPVNNWKAYGLAVAVALIYT